MNAKDETNRCVKLREGLGPAMMLDLRTLAGEHWAFPYPYLIFSRYDKDTISMRFSSHSVIVKGRTLDALYEAFLIQRVESIRAEDRRYDIGPETDPYVYSVEVRAIDDQVTPDS